MPTWQGVGAVEGSTGTLTPTMPSGIAADDILLLVCESQQGQGVTLSTANGFAETASSPQNAGVGGAPRTAVFWKRAVGSDSAPVVADPGDHVVGVMCLIRGCKTSGNPWNISGGGVDTGFGSAAITITGGTTTVDNCLVVMFDPDEHSTVTRSGWTNADLSNLTERVDTGVSFGTGGSIGIVTGEKITAGAFGNTTGTRSANSYKAWILLALEGAAAAGGAAPAGLPMLGAG